QQSGEDPNMKTYKLPIYALIPLLFITTNHAKAIDTLKKIEIIGESQNERRKNKEEMFYKPYSKQIIDEKTIREENIPDIAEAVRDIPGINVTKLGAFSRTIKVRGLQGPRVATLIDGIKLSNQGLNRSGAGETGMQDIANVKSIEVIKGSPAVIYDPGAAGGVINIITHKAPLKKGVGLKQTLGYDEGYDKKKSTTVIDASTGKVGVRFSYSNTEARDYKISGEADKNLAIERSNIMNTMSPTFLEINDLGYNTESLYARLSVKAGQDGIIDIDWNNWTGKDMTLLYGAPTIDEAILVQYDRMDRNSHAISYRKDNLGKFSNLNFKYSKQSQFQAIGSNAIGVKLNSEQVNLVSDIYIDDLIVKVGAEIIKDNARTLVYSTQDYAGVFTNLEYINNDWTLFGGARWNQWDTTQKLLSGTNRVVAEQLVGISGITPPKNTSAPTFAVGAQYGINQQNNISINLNTTFRNPNLLERYAFGDRIGGGIDMKPEEGKHAEILWKYLNPNLSMTTGIFYSEFENYIWTKQIKHLTNPAGYAACINSATCDEVAKEDEYFESYFKYYNSEQVTNWGMEFDVHYSTHQHEIIFSSSFNEVKSNDIFVQSSAQPIDSNISYRYEFNNNWHPWVKIKGQYVLDLPKVKQHLGFDPYSLFSAYAGFNKNDFIVSGGVRNLMDKEYRVPYSGINGLSRTFFINVSYEWHSSND
ncbi:MAG TPA: TonB-dependent receptor, partial [Flavobacteriaceae bacterium]|nr:TonB-dependent receptor [Flavobacteriaceae bacterium]